MKRIPLFYKTDENDKVLSLSTRSDKLGHVYHCVEFPSDNSEIGKDYAMFSHLSSALDFIQTNFKA